MGSPDQERDEHGRWTVGASVAGDTREHPGEKMMDHPAIQNWVHAMEDSPANARAIRDPSTKRGAELQSYLDKMPDHEAGTVYRGMMLKEKDVAKLAAQKEVTLNLHAASTKEESVAHTFANPDNWDGNKQGVVMKVDNAVGKQIAYSSDEHSDYHDELGAHEVILEKGSRLTLLGVRDIPNVDNPRHSVKEFHYRYNRKNR